MKSTKEHLVASLIVVVSFIVIGISVSYAFYENSVITTGDTGLSVTSGSLTMNFETLNGQIINANASGLINDDEIFNTEQYTSFSVSMPSNSEIDNAVYTLYLTDIKMSCNFKSEYLKWRLYDENNLTVNEYLAEGDFSNINLLNEYSGNCKDYTNDETFDANDLTIKSNIDITKGGRHSYRLYMWLSYSDSVLQNELLEGSLSTKVGFKATNKNT